MIDSLQSPRIEFCRDLDCKSECQSLEKLLEFVDWNVEGRTICGICFPQTTHIFSLPHRDIMAATVRRCTDEIKPSLKCLSGGGGAGRDRQTDRE